ncbi:MAG: hypothetical protein NW237_15990 [Cyanobacteriota bacterium]|nr:hypothetical protein [Cyanobacteriota bacterium]
MGRSKPSPPDRAKTLLRQSQPLLLEVFTEARLLFKRWDSHLDRMIRQRGMKVDASVPKVLIYVLLAVVILLIPPLTLVVVIVGLTWFAIRLISKQQQQQQANRYQRQRQYLTKGEAEEDP